MKKRWLKNTILWEKIWLKKMFWRMNYLACFLLLGVLSVSAEVYSQEGMISLKMKDVSLVEVFNEITRKTGYDFLYNYDVVQHKGNVSVNAKTVQLKTLLRDLLSSKDLEYEFKDDVIIVRNRTDEFVQVIPQSVKKRTVVGTVKDSKGEPIPGASIIVKGTQTGVATDIDGKFEIRVDDVAGVIFQISFVGMKNKEVKLGTSNVLNVVSSIFSENSSPRQASNHFNGAIVSSAPIIVKRGRSLCAMAAIPSTSFSFNACCIRSTFLPVSSIKV